MDRSWGAVNIFVSLHVITPHLLIVFNQIKIIAFFYKVRAVHAPLYVCCFLNATSCWYCSSSVKSAAVCHCPAAAAFEEDEEEDAVDADA